MHALSLDSVITEASEALRAGNVGLAEQLIFPALDQKPHHAVLWFYAGVVLAAQGKHAVALECFTKSYALSPNPAIWSNAGACLRYMQDVEGCRALLEIGHEHAPWDAHITGNLCGSYVNEGNPMPGIAYGEPVKDDPAAGPSIKFNLGLLHLEAGNFAKGFDYYASGSHHLRRIPVYEPDLPELTPEMHSALRGAGNRILVVGEQGIGDELMMATMLGDARKDFEIVFDSHPRLETLHHGSTWNTGEGYKITIQPTRKDQGEKKAPKGCIAKIALGNLGQFYRRTRESFPAGPFYQAREPALLVEQYRARLLGLAGGRKIVGLAMRGGTLSTARMYRMMPPEILDALVADESLFFVSLDYEDMTPVAERLGDRYCWLPSILWHWDYHHTAALAAATDVNVTVCQSVAHISAAMGHPTLVITPSKAAWRYGLTGEDWYWYGHPNVRLLRQSGDSWSPAATRLAELLQAPSLLEVA